VDSRRLRLALSSRPASGGSPTRRMEFIAEHAVLRAERAQRAVEVRERAAALEAERRRGIARAAELRAAQRREEEARAAEARVLAELQERRRQWTGIVGLCSKLAFLAEQVVEDRRVRALRALRKEAAVKIATWYKGVLLRRRKQELLTLIGRLRGLLPPYMPGQLETLRQRCALRIVSFLQYAASSNMAVVGVRKLKAGIATIQTAWRNALLVRKLQRSALYNQLTRVEREIVGNNKRAERSLQNQILRLGKSVNILEPDLGLAPGSPTRAPPPHATSHHHYPAASAAAAAASYNPSAPPPPRTSNPGGTATGGGGGGGGGGGSGGSSASASAIAGINPLAFMSGALQAGAAEGGGGGAMLERTTTTTTSSGGGRSRQYDRSRQPGRGVLHDPGDEQDEVLRQHYEMVPREVREISSSSRRRRAGVEAGGGSTGGAASRETHSLPPNI
ncbi:hypothetical protein Agub_g6138, partial [Astrephomene gubernaculifera]